MVSNYVGLIKRRYENQLDADATEFISYAVDGAKRMHGLIQDLLDFSRVGTQGKAFVPTNFGKILTDVLLTLSLRIEETEAKITFDQLPTLSVDQGQIASLFQNLIGNALKYRAPDKPPKIHIEAKLANNAQNWIFTLSDNGIGIDPEYHERIFLIFQRLHDRSQYEGTGIGLAICKKIVERHGGSIWLESTPDVGSTFFFTLPVMR
jgi:light-regulated signal transduction histidine kinase (bacteriophytochrome)